MKIPNMFVVNPAWADAICLELLGMYETAIPEDLISSLNQVIEYLWELSSENFKNEHPSKQALKK